LGYNEYNFVVLTNDSYIIHNPIRHFLNLAAKNNVELYGYNDSHEMKYHYQSYLFVLRVDAVTTFISKVNTPGLVINGLQRFDITIKTIFPPFSTLNGLLTIFLRVNRYSPSSMI
jgi:hypothetical protein